MAVVKRSISFTPELLAEAQREADLSFDGNLSAVVADALDRQLRNRRLGRALDAWEAKYGAPTEEELAETQRELDALWD